MTKLYITDSMMPVWVALSQANGLLPCDVAFVVITSYAAYVARTVVRELRHGRHDPSHGERPDRGKLTWAGLTAQPASFKLVTPALGERQGDLAPELPHRQPGAASSCSPAENRC